MAELPTLTTYRETRVDPPVVQEQQWLLELFPLQWGLMAVVPSAFQPVCAVCLALNLPLDG
jgi:hypothetical protein